MLQTVVEAGLNTSHMGIYTRPAPQRMHNLERVFAPPMAAFLKGWEAE
jgi:hypothetical protein